MSEQYATTNQGNYPLATTSLTGATPAYINKDYCGQTMSGYTFSCTFASGAYTFIATPTAPGTSGTTTYTMTTGGVLTP
ncbi:MAG: hypothetical protein HQL18_02105 [Candidatus Omnitrophica bacterium]|nr:hypothetical protein [Candidatus Omnitrophota bacterium]